MGKLTFKKKENKSSKFDFAILAVFSFIFMIGITLHSQAVTKANASSMLTGATLLTGNSPIHELSLNSVLSYQEPKISDQVVVYPGSPGFVGIGGTSIATHIVAVETNGGTPGFEKFIEPPHGDYVADLDYDNSLVLYMSYSESNFSDRKLNVCTLDLNFNECTNNSIINAVEDDAVILDFKIDDMIVAWIESAPIPGAPLNTLQYCVYNFDGSCAAQTLTVLPNGLSFVDMQISDNKIALAYFDVGSSISTVKMFDIGLGIDHEVFIGDGISNKISKVALSGENLFMGVYDQINNITNFDYCQLANDLTCDFTRIGERLGTLNQSFDASGDKAVFSLHFPEVINGQEVFQSDLFLIDYSKVGTSNAVARLTNHLSEQQSPSIDGDELVWLDYRINPSYMADVFYANLSVDCLNNECNTAPVIVFIPEGSLISLVSGESTSVEVLATDADNNSINLTADLDNKVAEYNFDQILIEEPGMFKRLLEISTNNVNWDDLSGLRVSNGKWYKDDHIIITAQDFDGDSQSLLNVEIQRTPVEGGWADWLPCDEECGGGMQTRYCVNPSPEYGGTCPGGVTFERRECNTQACVPIDGGWGQWGSCSRICGGGEQTRTCNNPFPEHGGTCPGGLLEETRSCNINACILPNGDFQDGEEHWSGFAFYHRYLRQQGNNTILQMNQRPHLKTSLNHDTIPVVAGKTYVFSAFTGVDISNGYVEVLWKTNKGVTKRKDKFTTSGTFVAPPKVTKMKLKIVAEKGDGGFLIDNIMVTEQN